MPVRWSMPRSVQSRRSWRSFAWRWVVSGWSGRVPTAGLGAAGCALVGKPVLGGPGVSHLCPRIVRQGSHTPARPPAAACDAGHAVLPRHAGGARRAGAAGAREACKAEAEGQGEAAQVGRGGGACGEVQLVCAPASAVLLKLLTELEVLQVAATPPNRAALLCLSQCADRHVARLPLRAARKRRSVLSARRASRQSRRSGWRSSLGARRRRRRRGG